MRKINDHKVNVANEALQITVLDEPGAGGASHQYLIEVVPAEAYAGFSLQLNFQNGPIRENGTNGVTQEALLAIVVDRLQSFQEGEFSCRENAVALTHLQTGLLWLQKRTLDRERRGVEGTHQL